MTQHNLFNSDSGSLVPLVGEETATYVIRVYTELFASEQHIKRVNNGERITKEELFEEDLYQLRQTYKWLF